MKFNFLPPPKKKVLIFDRNFDQISFFKLFNKKDCSILDVRYESINIFILFITFFKNFFWNIRRNYLIEYIKYATPKIVVTFIDNNFFFYELKNFYPKPLYISIQNARRTKDFFSLLKKNKKKNLCSDYMFVSGNYSKKIILNYIKSKVIAIGQLKNNFFSKKQKEKKIKSIVFISSGKINFISEVEILILKFLKIYCLKKKLKLFFFDKYSEEKLNLKENLHIKKLIIENAIILKRKKNFLKQLDKFNLFITLHSTLGYEMLAKKKKVIFFPCVDINRSLNLQKFGSPQKLSDRGFFWYNYYNPNVLIKIINNVIKIDRKRWEIKIKGHNLNHMNFNRNNLKIKSILKNIY